MLVRAKFEGDKIKATHMEPMADLIRYANDQRKDPSNGFSRKRMFRKIGSFNNTTLLDYDQSHPGWMARAQGKDPKERQKAWREFMRSEWGRPTATVNPLTV